MLVQLIQFIHLLIMLYIIIAPFTSSCYHLILHSIIVPFLILHWKTNNDMCILTLIEQWMTGKEDSGETFVGRIVKPVYTITNKDIYMIVTTLWFITVYKLLYYPCYYNYYKQLICQLFNDC